MDATTVEKYAEAVVRKGINLQPGECAQVGTSVAGLPLARAVVRALYRTGAKHVVVRIVDDEMQLARFEDGNDDVFDDFPDFEVDYAEAMMKERYHRIVVLASDPGLLAGVDPARLARAQKAQGTKFKRLQKYQNEGHVKWCLVAYPHPAWAAMVFPDLPQDEAEARLGDAIVQSARMGGEDPVADWTAHNETIRARKAWLNEQRFTALHYVGPGTDLTIGLGDTHVWAGGAETSADGCDYHPNMPTEECFTAPHKDRVDGTLRATKPLSVQGNLIEGMEFVFKDGKVVEFRAEKNGEVLENMMNMDEGARRLGEVALVPNSSPISQSGILFYNTLFDENASCHLALGQSYAETFEGGPQMSDEERAGLGANESMIHVDFMVGGPELDITGITADGTEVPVFVKGEWAS